MKNIGISIKRNKSNITLSNAFIEIFIRIFPLLKEKNLIVGIEEILHK